MIQGTCGDQQPRGSERERGKRNRYIDICCRNERERREGSLNSMARKGHQEGIENNLERSCPWGRGTELGVRVVEIISCCRQVCGRDHVDEIEVESERELGMATRSSLGPSCAAPGVCACRSLVTSTDISHRPSYHGETAAAATHPSASA